MNLGPNLLFNQNNNNINNNTNQNQFYKNNYEETLRTFTRGEDNYNDNLEEDKISENLSCENIFQNSDNLWDINQSNINIIENKGKNNIGVISEKPKIENVFDAGMFEYELQNNQKIEICHLILFIPGIFYKISHLRFLILKNYYNFGRF